MMKKISEGYCANVVNMVGCVTLQEPLCLITEFVAHGDLLGYLRKQRKRVIHKINVVCITVEPPNNGHTWDPAFHPS